MTDSLLPNNPNYPPLFLKCSRCHALNTASTQIVMKYMTSLLRLETDDLKARYQKVKTYVPVQDPRASDSPALPSS